jgi:hypothetical protein
LHLQPILAQVVAVDADLTRFVFDNGDFSPGSLRLPGDMQKQSRFAGSQEPCDEYEFHWHRCRPGQHSGHGYFFENS